MSELHDPQPRQLWSTPTGRTVEIVARETVRTSNAWDEASEIDVVAFHFVGGTMIHLRSAEGLKSWRKMQPE